MIYGRSGKEVDARLDEIALAAKKATDLGTAYWKIVRARELLTDVRAYLASHPSDPYYAAALLDALNASAPTESFLKDETAKSTTPEPGART